MVPGPEWPRVRGVCVCDASGEWQLSFQEILTEASSPHPDHGYEHGHDGAWGCWLPQSPSRLAASPCPTLPLFLLSSSMVLLFFGLQNQVAWALISGNLCLLYTGWGRGGRWTTWDPVSERALAPPLELPDVAGATAVDPFMRIRISPGQTEDGLTSTTFNQAVGRGPWRSTFSQKKGSCSFAPKQVHRQLVR